MKGYHLVKNKNLVKNSGRKLLLSTQNGSYHPQIVILLTTTSGTK